MQIHQHGIEIKRNFISKKTIDAIKNEISQTNTIHSKYGIRSADKKFLTIRVLANSDQLINLAELTLGSEVKLVRVLFFDKTADKNWLVTWHQDKTIAVNKKIPVTGWGPWSIKDTIHHVQPCLDVLNKMITFRLHLDDANEDNGCLKIISKSHQLGILSQQEITQVVNSIEPYYCRVLAGDLLLMKPHLLHSSSKSIHPGHRRVVHLEYSNYQLPERLDWA